MKVFTLNDAIKKQSKDREFKEFYDRELLINVIAKMAVERRQAVSLTQSELAKRAGTTQSVIARLESGTDKRIPSLDLLARIASASNTHINITFESDSPNRRTKV